MYQDSGHRPHARHTNESPRNEIKEAPYHLSVTLDTWGPVDNLFPSLYDALQSNWGDAPSRTMDVYQASQPDPDLEDKTGWRKLNADQQTYIDKCFRGETLPQVLERITFSFLIDGCTRAATHQIVRSRIGAGFMQHGGRDNDWRHRPWIMPETIRRACAAFETNMREGEVEEITGRELHHPISNWKPITDFLRNFDDGHGLKERIVDYLQYGRELYSALVDAGIPWEDARRLLWMGTSTYIHADYNYLALRGFLERRLEHIMDWEINCIAQLMLREIKMKCPPVFSKYLGSASDRAGRAMFAGLQSWPPDGKYPNPYEKCGKCDWPRSAHSGYALGHDWQGIDSLPREHRPEQNPYWVLHPDSMNGGPIQWIPTNGTYPHEVIHAAHR